MDVGLVSSRENHVHKWSSIDEVSPEDPRQIEPHKLQSGI
jgi:hypothetical protein